MSEDIEEKAPNILQRIWHTARKKPLEEAPPKWDDVTQPEREDEILDAARDSSFEDGIIEQEDEYEFNSEKLTGYVKLGKIYNIDKDPRENLTLWAMGFDKGFRRNVRQIEAYSTTDNDHTLNLIELLPEGWELWHIPAKINSGYSDSGDKRILISGDLTEPKTLIIALHEIGHARKDSAKDKKSLRRMQRIRKHLDSNLYMTTNELAMILEDERDAWSFALKHLRPFVRSKAHKALTIDQLRRTIHDDALASYNADIADRMGKDVLFVMMALAKHIPSSSIDADEPSH